MGNETKEINLRLGGWSWIRQFFRFIPSSLAATCSNFNTSKLIYFKATVSFVSAISFKTGPTDGTYNCVSPVFCQILKSTRAPILFSSSKDINALPFCLVEEQGKNTGNWETSLSLGRLNGTSSFFLLSYVRKRKNTFWWRKLDPCCIFSNFHLFYLTTIRTSGVLKIVQQRIFGCICGDPTDYHNTGLQRNVSRSEQKNSTVCLFADQVYTTSIHTRWKNKSPTRLHRLVNKINHWNTSYQK